MANKNINIGTFSWDYGKMQDQLAANAREMMRFAEVIKQGKKEVAEFSKEIRENEARLEAERRVQERLAAQQKAGTVSQQQYTAELAKSTARVDALVAEEAELAKKQADRIIAVNQLQQQTKQLSAENAELNKLMNAGRTELSGQESAYRNLNKELNALKTEAKNLGAEMYTLEKQGKKDSEEYRQLAARFAETSEKADKLNDVFKKIDKSSGDNQRSVGDYKDQILAAAKEMGVLEGVSKEIASRQRQLTAEFKSGAVTQDQYEKKSAELSQELKKVESQIKDLKREQSLYHDELKKSGEAQKFYQDQMTESVAKLVGAFGELRNGNIGGFFESVKESVGGLKTTFGNLFNFLMANPWVLVIAGIAAFVKEMWEFNAQTLELNKTVEQIANTSGAATDELRKSAAALAETYGGDFGDRVRELNSLMTDFGLTSQQAFELYNQGLATGGALNSEFADSIREYGPLFAESGYTAQEFINILNAGVDLDIYSDKLPDAIKEAGLSLKEQSKATRDALVNAFGATFADEILTKVQRGEMSVADALENISAKAKEAHLNEQQLAQLTADVFKGAGEDAGGALKIFEAINRAQELNAEGLTDIQKQTIELANLNRELEDAKEAAFKSDTVMAFGQDVKNIWKQIQIAWYNALDNITGFLQGAINGWRLGFMNVRDFIAMVPQAFRSVIGGMKADFQNLGDVARTFGAVIKSAFTFDVAGVEANFNTLMGKIRNFQSQTKAEIGKVNAQMGTGGSINQKNVRLINAKDNTNAQIAKSEATSTAKGGKVTGSVADAAAKADADAAKAEKKSADARVREAEKAKKEQEKRLREQEVADKKAADEALKLAQDLSQEKIDIAKNELAKYIADNAAKLDSDKRLNVERIAELNKYYDEVRAKKQAELDAEKARELEKADLSAQDRKNIEEEYSIKSKELTNETEQSKADIQKRWSEQTAEDEKLHQSIQFQQKILDMEANHDSEFEIRQAQADNEREINLEKLEEDYSKKLISDENYLAQKNLIEAQYSENTKQIDKATNDAKLNAYSAAFGGIKDLVGEGTALGKAAGIAETSINTYKAAQAAYAAGASLGGPLGAVMGPVLAGLAVAAGLKNVAKIAGIGTPKKAARGTLIKGPSHTDGGVPISTPNGMIEAEGGEPILTKKSFQMFPKLISDINVAGGGIPLYAQGGLAGVSPSSLSTVQTNVSSAANLEVMTAAIAHAVFEGAAAGTHTGSQSGITDLAANRKIAEGANF